MTPADPEPTWISQTKMAEMQPTADATKARLQIAEASSLRAPARGPPAWDDAPKPDFEFEQRVAW